MLGLSVRNTKKLVREKVKESNIRLGRLFTKRDQAALLASYTPTYEKEEVFLLDPGAGTGILSAAAIEEIAKKSPAVRRINLTAFETNADFLPLLADNLERVRKKTLPRLQGPPCLERPCLRLRDCRAPAGRRARGRL